MKSLLSVVSICSLLLGLSSSDSCAEPSPVYCGKLLWPSQRADYLPFPEGMEVTYSTEPAVARAIKKSGKYTVRFVYGDMTISYRLMQDAVDTLITAGQNQACLKAGTVRRSRWKTPIEVSPLISEDGRVVFERSHDNPTHLGDDALE